MRHYEVALYQWSEMMYAQRARKGRNSSATRERGHTVSCRAICVWISTHRRPRPKSRRTLSQDSEENIFYKVYRQTRLRHAGDLIANHKFLVNNQLILFSRQFKRFLSQSHGILMICKVCLFWAIMYKDMIFNLHFSIWLFFSLVLYYSLSKAFNPTECLSYMFLKIEHVSKNRSWY